LADLRVAGSGMTSAQVLLHHQGRELGELERGAEPGGGCVRIGAHRVEGYHAARRAAQPPRCSPRGPVAQSGGPGMQTARSSIWTLVGGAMNGQVAAKMARAAAAVRMACSSGVAANRA